MGANYFFSLHGDIRHGPGIMTEEVAMARRTGDTTRAVQERKELLRAIVNLRSQGHRIDNKAIARFLDIGYKRLVALQQELGIPRRQYHYHTLIHSLPQPDPIDLTPHAGPTFVTPDEAVEYLRQLKPILICPQEEQ